MVRLFFGLTAAWLFVSCLVTTNYIIPDPDLLDEVSWLCPDHTLLQCLLFVLVCLIPLFLCCRTSTGALSAKRNLSAIRFTLILLFGVLACVLILVLRPAPSADARSVQRAASDLAAGQLYLFQPGEYMYVYPHQSGLLLFHLLLQKISPDTTLPFQFLNVLCYMGILYLLGELAKELGLGESGCLGATCAGGLFLPLLFYVSFVYGTIPGLFFSMAALVLSIRFCQNIKWHYALGAGVFLLLAVMVKSNYQIFGIGLMLYAVYNGLRGKKHAWGLLALLVLGWLTAAKLPVFLVEKWTGCNLHNGVATVSWLAMGLRTDSTRGPGWYDEYTLSTYFSANMDPKLQSAVALDNISGIFQGYLMAPLSAVRFFTTKNATQWCDPLFQGVWLLYVMHTVSGIDVPHWMEAFLNQQGPTVFVWLMNLLQTLVYGGLVLWAWVPTHEKRKPQEDLLAVIFVGGFVFHTFWEAKSQYTLPYVALILPLALLGYKRLAVLSRDKDVRALWQSHVGKLCFLMPVLLMVLALVLSLALAAPLNAALQELLQAI